MVGTSVMSLLLPVVGRLAGGVGVVGAAVYQPLVLAGLGVLVLVLMIGVVLPAVWSRKPARRQAAANVLRLLFASRVADQVRASRRQAAPRPHATIPATSSQSD